MTKVMAAAAAAILALGVSACANRPHTDQTMLSGSHMVPPKNGWMPDGSMPARSPDCTKEALANMPPEHRALCEKAQHQ